MLKFCMEKIKTIFIGTSHFGIPTLEYILNSENFELLCAITQPDRPTGRRQELTFSPVKKFLLEKNFTKIEQPEKIKDVASKILEKYKPELVVVASYGQIIPDQILDFPKYRCLNIHGSILPKLRGAVPVHMAILQGFKTTGVTIQRMVKEMDAGPIIAVKEINFLEDDTTETLMQKLSILGRNLFSETILGWVQGEIIEAEQNQNAATYCFKSDIEKEKAEIKFETNVDLAERMVRAFYPWPVAWVRLLNGKVLKIFKSKISENSKTLASIQSPKSTNGLGLSLRKEGKELILDLKNGSLVLEEVQLEGKRRDSGLNYLYLTETV